MTRIQPTLLAMATCLCATAAHANEDTVSVSVSITATELASQGNLDGFQERVRRAARAACAAPAAMPRAAVRQCRDEVEAELTARIARLRQSLFAARADDTNTEEGA